MTSVFSYFNRVVDDTLHTEIPLEHVRGPAVLDSIQLRLEAEWPGSLQLLKKYAVLVDHVRRGKADVDNWRYVSPDKKRYFDEFCLDLTNNLENYKEHCLRETFDIPAVAADWLDRLCAPQPYNRSRLETEAALLEALITRAPREVLGQVLRELEAGQEYVRTLSEAKRALFDSCYELAQDTYERWPSPR